MMTAESRLSKRPVLRVIVALFFLKLFSFHIYCIPKTDLFIIVFFCLQRTASVFQLALSSVYLV